MKATSGAGLIIIGFALLWLAYSGRFDCLSEFFQCMIGGTPGNKATGPSNINNTNPLGLPGVIMSFGRR